MHGLVLSLAASAVTVLPIQDAQPPPPTPSQEAVERLEKLDLAIEDYEHEWQEEQAKLREKYAADLERVTDEGCEVSMSAMAMSPDYSPFIATLSEWVEGSEGEDQALYLTRICRLATYGDGVEGRDALERLLVSHAKSPTWARLGQMLPFLEARFGKELEGGVVARLTANPSPDVRGWVALTLHRKTIESAERDSKEYAAAREAVTAAARGATDEGLRDELKGLIEVREKFGVGLIAPDIEGVDLDGAAFRLSDYKGQILFVDFWGDW
ncbi:MAG: hypothetical protein CMJ84_00520 [Planctomycetes bacterium]|jgi:hypothetical protein|nr:hypothetical protein [Planctomycetota bacterium]MDP6410618.1 hypothetical protein [Planctomycetota bacterium]